MVLTVVAASAAAGFAGSMLSASAASHAADVQAAAAERAAELQMAQYKQTRADLLPYNTAGQTDLPAFQDQYKETKTALTGAFDRAQALSTPGTSTQAELEATPGYQFSLSQGLQSTQASAAARGLGVSGASMKGASNFATGLANNTYQNVFNQQQQLYNNANSQFSNVYNGENAIYNQLQGVVNTGENAAAQTGAAGTAAAANAGSNIAAAGQAQAAGITTSANNISNGLNNLSQAPMNYLMANKFLNG